MKYSEKLVFYRTKLGEAEILKKEASVLPKGLRSLLLFIDGKTDLKHYRAALNNSKLLASIGTIDQCLDTLMDLSLVNAKGLSGPGTIDDFSEVTETVTRQPQETSKVDSFEARQRFEKYRTIVIECIEKDLGNDSWQASLEIEECVDAATLGIVIEGVYNQNKNSFSKESKKILATLFKKIKNGQ